MLDSLLYSINGPNATLWAVLGIVLFIVFILVLKGLIIVADPDTVLVITGRKKSLGIKKFGFSVERGRTFKIPYFQTAGKLDIGVIPINVRVEGVNSANGITVGADATACVCIDDDDEGMIYTAVERLMGKSREQIKEQIKQTLVGNFRGALNKATPLQAIGMDDCLDDMDEKGDRALFRQELLNDINSDLSSFGMKVVSVSFQKIWDTSNYIANLAQETLVEKRKQVEIEEARLAADAEKAESDCERLCSVSKSNAEGEILTAREKLEMYRRESQASIEEARLDAKHSIEEAKNRIQKEIELERVELQKVRNQTEIIIKAEADQKCAEILAEGEQASIDIVEGAKNEILRQKVEMLQTAGDIGRIVLFIQQQLPGLYKSYTNYAKNVNIDSMLVMDNETGFKGAVNRGPSAFVDFLSHFESVTGVSIKDLITPREVK